MSSQTPVTLLGLGEMGRPIAAAFLAAGRPTTVWNRTASKADELVAKGAVRADSVADAVAAGPLVVACLLDYDTVHRTLDPVAGQLRGKTLVNLTNGTPAQADEMAEWAARNGVEYLDGGIMAIPTTLGTPEAFILYSGPEQVFQAHREVLEVLGAPKYLGTDIGLASLYDLALLSGHFQMLQGFHHAVAMATSRKGGSAAGFTELLVPWLTNISRLMPVLAAEVDADRESGAEPNIVQGLDVLGAGILNILTASREAGVDSTPLEAYANDLDGLRADGHRNWSAPALVRRLQAG
ncbi:NAD(P)-binding domain-containing protein [Streptomyces sp. NPDC003077]|uniref:NAD(P)-dependent oxidoreductase n=1 Tax=Streptomyces sp. NPDC003077 TaxID=3154443 RepID=UPI0033BF5E72